MKATEEILVPRLMESTESTAVAMIAVIEILSSPSLVAFVFHDFPVANRGSHTQSALGHLPAVHCIAVLDLTLVRRTHQRYRRQEFLFASKTYLTATRALGLKETRTLPEVVPVIVLLSESSVRGQTARAQTTLNRSLGKVEATKALRVFRNPSEQWKTPNVEGEFLLGRLTVNFVEMSAHDNGEPVVLTTMEFKALQYFVQNPRRVISRGELLNQVWGYENYPRTRTVDNHILRLRQKLEQNPSRPMHIRTVHGAGYKFLP